MSIKNLKGKKLCRSIILKGGNCVDQEFKTEGTVSIKNLKGMELCRSRILKGGNCRDK